MTTLSAAWTIACKDLRTYYRDRTGMLLGFLLPIALVSVFGFVMSVAFGGQGGMPKAMLWVSDRDDSETSRGFIEQLRKVEMLQVRPREGEPPRDADAVRQLVEDGDAPHALVIEPGFGAAVGKAQLPKLTLIRDPGRAMEDRVVRIGIMQAAMIVSEGRTWPAALGDTMRRAGMSDAQVKQIVEASTSMQGVIRKFAAEEDATKAKQSTNERRAADDSKSADSKSTDAKRADAERSDDERSAPDIAGFMNDMLPVDNVDIQRPHRPKLLSYQLAQSVCGMTVMMLMFGLMATSTMLLYERESGTLRRLLVAAVPRDAILWGKYLFSAVIGVAQLALLFAYGNMVFDINAFRDVPTLVVVSLTWVAAATSFGMLIAAWAKSSKQAEGLSTLLILVMAALGGCWFPIQMMELPPFADAVTKSTLTYWAMSAYQGMFWQQLAWHENKMLLALGIQWAFAILAAIAALALFRRRYVPG